MTEGELGRLRFLRKHCFEMLKNLPQGEISLRTFWKNAMDGFDKRIQAAQ